MNKELIEAKRKLYVLLLDKPNDKLTDMEVDEMFALSRDEDIQNLLNKKP